MELYPIALQEFGLKVFFKTHLLFDTSIISIYWSSDDTIFLFKI